MADLIYRDTLLEKRVPKEKTNDLVCQMILLEDVMSAPTVDAVEVVRCSKCVMHDNCYAEDVFKTVRMDLEKTFCCMGSERKADER